MPQFALLLGVLLVIGGGALGQTTDWFVDATNPGPGSGTKVDPFRAFTSAANVANDDDRIFVAPGTYGPTSTGELFPIQFGAVISQLRLKIIAVAGPATTILDGQGLTSGGNGIVRFRLLAAGSQFCGFTLTGYTGTLAAIRLGSTTATFEATDVEICHCVIRDATVGSGIASFGASNLLRIHDNLVVNCYDNGIWGSDVTCNTVGGFGGGGEIWNNTVINCGYGIRVQGGTWTVMNNIVTLSVNAGLVDFGVTGGCGPAAYTMNYNCLWANATDYLNVTPVPGIVPGPNDLLADPLLLNPAAGDAHIVAGSPCQDAGNSALPPWVASDIDLGPRLVTGPSTFLRPDIGADEITDVALNQIGPASISFGVVGFDTIGPPGDYEMKAYAFAPANLVLPGVGNLLLDPLTLSFIDPAPNLIPPSGNSLVGIPLGGFPPSLIGFPVWLQAAVFGAGGARLTNLVQIVICP